MSIGKKALEDKNVLAVDASDKYRYFTLAEIVSLVGLSRSTLLIYCRTGRLKAVKLGTKWRVAKPDLDEFLAKGDSKEISVKPEEDSEK